MNCGAEGEASRAEANPEEESIAVSLREMAETLRWNQSGIEELRCMLRDIMTRNLLKRTS